MCVKVEIDGMLRVYTQWQNDRFMLQPISPLSHVVLFGFRKKQSMRTECVASKNVSLIFFDSFLPFRESNFI